MAGKMTFLMKLRSFLQNINNTLSIVSRSSHQQGMFGMPAMSYDYGLVPGREANLHRSPQVSLTEIFGRILNYKVPRSRRSLERRHIRKHSEFYFKDAKPKTNIITCLTCGSAYEAETVCGNCYSKVREETKVMRESMDQDKYYYDHPRQEVAYMYEGESVDQYPKYKGRYIVEVQKKRPYWFPSPLTEKDDNK